MLLSRRKPLRKGREKGAQDEAEVRLEKTPNS